MAKYPFAVNLQVGSIANNIQIFTVAGLIEAVSDDEAFGKAHKIADRLQGEKKGSEILGVIVGPLEPILLN